MKTLIYLLSLISIISFASCEKEDQEPFADCKDDPNCEYFRCKVNGEWWTPYCEQGPLFGCNATDVQYYKDLNGGGLSIIAENTNNDNGVVLRLWNIKKINIQNSFKRNNLIDSHFFDSKTSSKYYVDDSKQNEFILISIDTTEFIISGKFSFIGVTDNGETISINDGEFRQKYRF